MQDEKAPNPTSKTPAPSKVEEITNYILRKIRTKEYLPGDKLPTENEFCELTGISRTSIREAIKRLEALSIVQIRRGEGTFISRPDQVSYKIPFTYKILLNDITFSEILRFREMIEYGILRCSIENADEEAIDELCELNETMRKADTESLDIQRVYDADYAFHVKLGQICGNSILADLYDYTYQTYGVFVKGNYQVGQTVESSYEMHNMIILALRRRDSALAAYATAVGHQNWAYWIRKQTSNEFYFLPSSQDDF
ncbi:MAG: FadR family transcriptional regulator [Lachnospiraceae bacterium]|nr:FadR family transcriptional regulator [Lachnospiraceae bacterium]